MKKLLLTGIAALFLATGTAHAQTYRGPTTADDPMYKVDPPRSKLDYRPQYDTRSWEAAERSKSRKLCSELSADEDYAGCIPYSDHEKCKDQADYDQCLKKIRERRSYHFKVLSQFTQAQFLTCGTDGDWHGEERTEKELIDLERCLKHLTKRAKPRAADIPQQYRGHWCETKWRTIYKRCTAGDMIVERDGWGVEDEGCTFQSVRSDKRYGGHRTVSVCQHVDSPDPPRRSEERWWLGSNGTRLQILETTSQVERTQ